MSDLHEMAKNTARQVLAEAATRDRLINIEAHLVDVFERGALWAMTRAAHAVSIARTVATKGADPKNTLDRVLGFEDGLRTGYDGAQKAVAATHQAMIETTTRPRL